MYKLLFTLTIFIFNSALAQKPINAYSKNEKIYVQYDNGQVKEIVSDKGNEFITFSRKNNLVFYQKVIKKSKLFGKEEGGSDAADQVSIYLFDINLNIPKLLFTTCFDGNGGTKPSYAESSLYPFKSICSPTTFLLTPDENRLFFESKAWSVCPSVHYYNIKDNKLVFFKAGWLQKIDDKGVYMQITGIDFVKNKGNTESNGRFWQNCLFDFNGNLIKNIGAKEH
jgi:hypothetical protein